MPSRLDRREAVDMLVSRPLVFLKLAFLTHDRGATPLTSVVLGVVLGLYGVEVAATLLTGVVSPDVFVNFLFINYPGIAWSLAPFFHRGLGHLWANVAFVYLAAPVERSTGTLRYLGLLLLAGFLPVYADGVKLVLLGDQPHVAAYGASGFAYGLLGYGLTINIGTDWRLTPRWWLVVAAGVAAMINVVINLLAATVDPVTVKIGHFGGLLVGAALGYRATSV